jgi:hypothetical protein
MISVNPSDHIIIISFVDDKNYQVFHNQTNNLPEDLLRFHTKD